MRRAVYQCARFAGVLLLLAGCGGDSSSAGNADAWTRFRGPNGSGLSTESPLPVTWAADAPNVRWSAPLPGFGGSSPIVVGSSVVVAFAEREGESLTHGVVALDVDSGEEQWRRPVATRKELVLRNRFGVHAGATPVSDERTIYAYFGAELAAIDDRGEIIWSVIVEPDYEETTRYGAGSSPVLAGDSIVILQDKEYAKEDYDFGWLAAFDRSNGELLWRHQLEDGCCSYTTPVLRQTAAATEIIVALSRKIVAFDLADGEILWEDGQDMNQPVASPVLDGDLLCVASGAHNVRETVCRRLSGAGADTTVEPLWRTNRTVAETASPLLYDGKLYVLVQKGMITTYAAETGQILWRQRLSPGAYHASLVGGDGKVYAFNNAGVTTVFSTAPEYEQLAVNDLGERGSIASPAIAGGRLYLRTAKHLVSIEPEPAGAPADTAS